MSRCWALNISSKCRRAVYLWHKKWLTLICTRLLMESTSPISTLSKGRTIFQFPRPLTNFHGILVSIHVSGGYAWHIFDKWRTDAVSSLRNLKHEARQNFLQDFCVTLVWATSKKFCVTDHKHNIISNFQINQPTRCNNLSSLLLDVYSYVQRNMFQASSRPSSGAQMQ
jgi:hypothetical protein